ncbi:unnamed protein product, partial [Symbiodinium sp. CCMP2456]
MVTVIDALNFMKDFGSWDDLVDRKIGLSEEDTRNVVDLLVDQVEFANVILVNKSDLVDLDQLNLLKSILERLNPTAQILTTEHGQVPLSRILGTGLFSLQEAEEHPEWLTTPRGEEATETEEYNIGSFVFRSRRPFHAERLWNMLNSEESCLAGVLRSKGFAWFATRHDYAYQWAQAGVSIQLNPAGIWWDAANDEYWPDEAQERTQLLSQFDGKYGDRRQELVFIGIDLDQGLIEERLHKCLLTDLEYASGPEVWKDLPDPLPAIQIDESESEEEQSFQDEFDVIVVGAGAAGVGVGVALLHAGIENFLILDRHEVGASFARWPKEMRFITPSFPTNSVGMLDINAVAIGTSPAFSLQEEHPNGRQYAAFLQNVAEFFQLPVRVGTEVNEIVARHRGYLVKTNEGKLHARFVIWAGGEFQYPQDRPFPGSEHCIHNASVKSWKELPVDDCLVIGGYESGIDAAVHLAKSGKKVTVLDRSENAPWKRDDSDPSTSLSTYTVQRLRQKDVADRVQLVSGVDVYE